MIRKIFVLLLALCSVSCFGDNPLITSCYSADPSVHIWPGSDAIWMYSSHDVHNATSHQSMREYRVFKSYDLVNWIDHGCVLDLKDIPWANTNAWAIDAVLYNGVYYLVYCAIHTTIGAQTGLAISDRPEGPFKDIGFIEQTGNDPSLFMDDDGQPYLFWGGGTAVYGAKLNKDLKSLMPQTKVALKNQLTNVFEGLWAHKYNGVYYLSYPGLEGGKWPEHMYYATSNSPLGPYTFKGEYMGEFPKMAGTNHGSIVQIKNRWYAFYHSAWLSDGNSTRRSIHAEYLSYNSDGTIKRITPTKAGVKALFPESAPESQPSKTFIVLEAENGPPAKGTLSGVRTDSSAKGFSGRGYATGFDTPGDFVTVTVNVAKSGSHFLRVFYRCEGTRKVNSLSINGQNPMDKTFPPADTFAGLNLGKFAFNAGDNTVKIVSREGGIDIDFFMITPELELFPPKQQKPVTAVAPERADAKTKDAGVPATVEYTRSGAVLRFELSSAQGVSIKVFSLSGKLVHRLVHGVLPKGEHHVCWNDGGQAAPGIYFFRLQTGSEKRSPAQIPVRLGL